MIQPNEIRVKNILHQLTAEGDVLETTIDGDSIKWCEEDPKGFNSCHFPIPLTEEVLLKCGFEIKKGRFGNNYKHEYLILYTTHSGAIGFVFESGIDVIVEIKSLHHLQNLFFALTGEELEYMADK